MKKLRPYVDHGFLELDNNSAERSMRCVALGRKNYLFMGSEGGGQSAAITYTLIETAKLDNVDPLHHTGMGQIRYRPDVPTCRGS
jgi:hypothetical protein